MTASSNAAAVSAARGSSRVRARTPEHTRHRERPPRRRRRDRYDPGTPSRNDFRTLPADAAGQGHQASHEQRESDPCDVVSRHSPPCPCSRSRSALLRHSPTATAMAVAITGSSSSISRRISAPTPEPTWGACSTAAPAATRSTYTLVSGSLDQVLKVKGAISADFTTPLGPGRFVETWTLSDVKVRSDQTHRTYRVVGSSRAIDEVRCDRLHQRQLRPGRPHRGNAGRPLVQAGGPELAHGHGVGPRHLLQPPARAELMPRGRAR